MEGRGKRRRGREKKNGKGRGGERWRYREGRRGARGILST